MRKFLLTILSISILYNNIINFNYNFCEFFFVINIRIMLLINEFFIALEIVY